MTDFSIVENRFQEILKQRLSIEIENNPPLFPWETEILEYPTEIYDEVSQPKFSLWFQEIALPIQFPTEVFSELIEACFNMFDSFSPQPIQMVNAVSKIFPGELSFLNDQATILAVAGANRGVETLEKKIALDNNLQDYDNCSKEQKMTFSLLAAQKILNALTLHLSIAQPSITREWELETGKIILKAEYLASSEKIRVEINVSEDGEITWENNSLKCNSLEPIIFDLNQVKTQKIYPIKIQLSDSEKNSLTCAIQIKEF